MKIRTVSLKTPQDKPLVKDVSYEKPPSVKFQEFNHKESTISNTAGSSSISIETDQNKPIVGNVELLPTVSVRINGEKERRIKIV